jgi:hypothetical protein
MSDIQGALPALTAHSGARVLGLAIVVAIGVMVCSPVSAQDRGRGPGGGPQYGGGAHMHQDNRFSHNQPYLNHGYGVRGRVPGGYRIHRGGADYYYDRRHWYRRNGGLSIVIGAPIGAFVPILPYYYSTVWWRGAPYYYANDTYYSWNGGEDEYEVVAPPDGIDSGGTTAPPPSDSVFIYPKNGQDSGQQARDKYECHRSAADQTGFDPTRPGGGVAEDVAATKRSDYMRAQAACLEARGYSVK